MKTSDLSDVLALEMDRVLSDEKNKELFSSASSIEKLAFKRVSEEDKPTEIEIELESALEPLLQKEASDASPVETKTEEVKTPETKESEATQEILNVLLKVSEDLDTLGFERLAAASAILAEKLVSEAKAKKTKSTKKTDPKAAVRNRGKVVFPAESPKVKDKKDHFPINSAAQARNALARSHQFDKAPSWYKGSLEELQAAVRRAVKKHYKDIDVSEPKKKSKKSALEVLLEKYGK